MMPALPSSRTRIRPSSTSASKKLAMRCKTRSRRKMWKTLIAITLSSALLGCKMDAKTQILCVPIKKYSNLTQDEFVKEWAEVKLKYPTVTQYIADYKSLRDALRKCKGE